MIKGVLRHVVLGTAVWISLPFAMAEQDEILISNVFVDARLRMALEDVSAQAGVNIIADPTVSGLVTVELDEVSVDKALELLLAGSDYQVYRHPDYYLVFSPDESSAIFPSVSETRLIRLDHKRAEEARAMLPNALQRYARVGRESNMLAITAPVSLLEQIVAELGVIDTPGGEQTRFVGLEHIRAGSARDLLPPRLQRYVRVDDERNTVAVTAPAGPLERILGQLDELDTPGLTVDLDLPASGGTELVKLGHVSAGTAMDLLPEALHAYVRPNAESNTLAVSAPAQIRAGILADLAAIDVPRHHVMLDARVVVLERGDLLDFGVNWDFPTATAGTFIDDETSPSWPWGLRIGFTPGREFTNALAMTLNMLTQNEEATIVSTPQVLAQDGKEAEISVVTEEWFEITTDATTFARAQLEQIETGTVLAITPQVGSNGELTLDMDIEVSDVVGRGASNLPVVSRRTAHSTVQVENGGTAAVAGLVDTRSRFTRTGVPGVGRLPLLGRAFRSDQLDHEARQVAVFVTATLVEESDRLFSDGRRELPPVEVIDEDEFRDALAAALSRLETGARRDE
ncbi:hypothetical protein LRF89_03170 [Halorhodospira sp. 9621]|uniref:type II secretion system protein GspD n=1 Tax=Halorhodospira sp. 9621 TaxID=2899135 RepID=UPI001EE7B2FE|nr:hypothetical protein [Halorhodospira sp. 9621]MCG5532438.1 hypothetical protein [Halorhodospira sp. 9621]